MALGFSVHTGWAAMVAVSRTPSSLVVHDRRRVGMLPVPLTPRPDASPYVFHAAREMPLAEAERFIQRAQEEAGGKAREELRAVIDALRAGDQSVAGSAIITAREMPSRSLEEILRSHSLVHAAEGVFFRSVLRRASEELGLSVLEVPGPDLVGRASQALGLSKDEVPEFLARIGRELGPPWTADHKAASLAAMLVLG